MFDPNADESGKIWDVWSFNYNMYWPLSNMYCEILDLGQEVGIIRVTFVIRMKCLYMYLELVQFNLVSVRQGGRILFCQFSGWVSYSAIRVLSRPQ